MQSDLDTIVVIFFISIFIFHPIMPEAEVNKLEKSSGNFRAETIDKSVCISSILFYIHAKNIACANPELKHRVTYEGEFKI